MAEAEEEAAPWDRGTDTFISNIDGDISKTYGISLRDFLLNPEKFASQKDIDQKAKKIIDAVNAYFTNAKNGLKEEQDELAKTLENADAQTTKIDGVIQTKAALSRVPYIKPVMVDINPSNREEIVIDQYNNSVDALIAKLINASNYIADITTTYNNHNIGSWVFSGNRTYIVSINLPESAVTAIDDLQSDVDDIMDTAYQRLLLAMEK